MFSFMTELVHSYTNVEFGNLSGEFRSVRKCHLFSFLKIFSVVAPKALVGVMINSRQDREKKKPDLEGF